MAYADSFDVAAQWRSLSGAESVRADALLDMAAILIGHHVDFTGVALDDWRYRVAKQVSIDMVVEALAPGARGPVSSYSVTMDDAVESATLRDGADTSTITLTRGMLALFGGGHAVATAPRWSFGDCAE